MLQHLVHKCYTLKWLNSSPFTGTQRNVSFNRNSAFMKNATKLTETEKTKQKKRVVKAIPIFPADPNIFLMNIL